MTKKNENINVEETKVEETTIEEETVETVDEGDVEVEVKESKFSKAKDFVMKHKKKILIGGLTLAAGIAGYTLGVKTHDYDFFPDCLPDSDEEPLTLESHEEVEISEETIEE